MLGCVFIPRADGRLARGTSLLSQPPLPGDSMADLEGSAQPGLAQARGEGAFHPLVVAFLLENPWVWWVWLPGSPGASQQDARGSSHPAHAGL